MRDELEKWSRDMPTSSDRLHAQIDALEAEVARLKARPCPHVVVAAGGTQHCALAEEAVRKVEELMATLLGERDTRIRELEEALDQLRKDALPDPYDERDVDMTWLRNRIHVAVAVLKEE